MLELSKKFFYYTFKYVQYTYSVILVKVITDKNGYIQQGIRGFFVGFPKDLSGQLFYVSHTRNTYVSLDAVFAEKNTFSLSEKILPADEIILEILVLKTKLNSYDGLDKLKAIICLEVICRLRIQTAILGLQQPLQDFQNVQMHAANNRASVYQLAFIQAFI